MTFSALRSCSALALVFPLVVACGDDVKDDTSCRNDPDFVQALEYDNAGPLGFSGADVVALAGTRRRATLTWHDGTDTKLTFEVTAPDRDVEAFAPPADAGYCAATLEVPQATLHLATDDQRLDVMVDAALVAVADDDRIAVLFAMETALDLAGLREDLGVAAAWSSDQRPDESLQADLWVSGTEQLSPYCLESDVPSMDSSDTCNIYDGRLVFKAFDPDADHHNPQAESYFSQAVAWWRWDEVAAR